MGGNRLYMWGFVVCIGVISYTDIRSCHRWPHPSRLVYSGIVFALLEVFSLFNEEIAGVSAIGFTLALLVNRKRIVGDCHLNSTGQPQTTSFITSRDQEQPASYAAFEPNNQQNAPTQPPGTTLV